MVEGAGPAIVMIHGWPDSCRLWDAQVAVLKDRYRCVRFTLPGFDRAHPKRAYPLDEQVQIVRRIVEGTCDGKPVTLLVHDWGCLLGYQFATRHPEMVERVIGVDIGDAGSRRHLAEIGLRGKLAVIAYQLWLAAAWRIGGAIGDAMARGMARLLRCPTDPRTIGAHMGYHYAMRWFGVAGGFHGLAVFDPRMPMLYLYGERKPVMFHSRAWVEDIASRPGSRVVRCATGHWIMVERPEQFNAELVAWLAGTA